MPIIFKLLLKISKYPLFQTYCVVSRIKWQIANSIIYNITYQHYSLVYCIYCINKNGKLQGIKNKLLSTEKHISFKETQIKKVKESQMNRNSSQVRSTMQNTGPFLPASMVSTSRTSIIMLYHRKKIHIPLLVIVVDNAIFRYYNEIIQKWLLDWIQSPYKSHTSGNTPETRIRLNVIQTEAGREIHSCMPHAWFLEKKKHS